MVKRKTKTKEKVVDESPEREVPDVQPATEEIPALEEVKPETEEEVMVAAQASAEEAIEALTKDVLASEETVADVVEEAPEEAVEEELGAKEEEEKLVDEIEPVKVDPPGIITPLSGEKYLSLVKTWQAQGNPRSFTALGQTWSVYTDGDGYKFVAVSGTPGMGYYNKVSTGRS